MSIALYSEEDQVGQVATEFGWASFIGWVDTLDVESYPDLVHLVEYGWDDFVGLLITQLSSAIESHPPDCPDCLATAQGLLVMLRSLSRTSAVAVG